MNVVGIQEARKSHHEYEQTAAAQRHHPDKEQIVEKALAHDREHGNRELAKCEGQDRAAMGLTIGDAGRHQATHPETQQERADNEGHRQ